MFRHHILPAKYTVGVKSMSPVDIELLFVSISYNIIALRLKIDIFL